MIDMRCLAVALMVASGATAQAQLEPLDRIGIRAGEAGAQFVLKESGTPFTRSGLVDRSRRRAAPEFFEILALNFAGSGSGYLRSTYGSNLQPRKRHT